MQYATSPLLTVLCLLFAAGSLIEQILCVSSAFISGLGKRSFLDFLRLFTLLASCFIWTLFLLLAINALTFSDTLRLSLRWFTAAVIPISVAAAFAEHDWIIAVPGIPLFFTLPFFEAAFGPDLFPFVLLGMLLFLFVAELICLVGERRIVNRRRPSLSIQEGIDALDDGILFAAPRGNILLCNSVMQSLSASLCKTKLRNANHFWQSILDFESTELATKIEHNGSILLRFAGGNTWAFYREACEGFKSPVVQIVALNVTASDLLRKTINMKRMELARISPAAIEAKDLDRVLSADLECSESMQENLTRFSSEMISVIARLREDPESEQECADALMKLSSALRDSDIRFV